MKKFVIVIIILAIVGLAVWRVGTIMKTRAQARIVTEELPISVEVQTVKRGMIQTELAFVGNIIADAEVTVFPKTVGKIEKMTVDEGDNVTKGAVLAKLEDKELSLRVKQAEVGLDTAKTAYSQAKALAEVRTKSQVAQAEAGLLGAEAALKQVQDIAKTRVSSQLDQAQASLDALKTNLKKIKDGARPEEKKQVESTVQQARAGMENAQADLDRIEKLYSDGAVSKQTLDSARTRTTVSNAQFDMASQQLKLVETGARAEDIQAMELQIKAAGSGLEIARSMSDSKSWEQDIEMAKSRYNQAKSALEVAQSFEKAKSWQAEIAGAEAGVKQAETMVALAKEALSYATVTAPISGTISKRNLDTGGMASSAMPLFTIVNANNVKAIIDVPEANLTKISLNKKAIVSTVGLSEPLAGQVTLISPVIKPTTRTATIEISIDNSAHKLKPGAFAKVTIPLDVSKDTTIVSRSAVLEEKGKDSANGKYLFVVENDKAIRRKVEVGLTQGDTLEILSGVKPGEKVVISGQNMLKDNGKVKITGVIE